MKKKRQLLSLLLVLCMLVSMVPSFAGTGAEVLPFTDVPSDAWYRNAVVYVHENGLMSGTSATTFKPELELTRAMFVTILGRLDHFAADKAGGTAFGDVVAGSWYAPYVGWALDLGVVTGYPDDTFRPGSLITREQMAAMLARYIAARGLTLDTIDVASAAFSDTQAMSDYAREGIDRLRSAGILSGDEFGQFHPEVTATRAEAAEIIARLGRQLDARRIAVVHFDANGGSDVADQSVRIGQTASKPAKPSRNGYIFVDWYSDASFKNVFDFTLPIVGETTLFARWTSMRSRNSNDSDDDDSVTYSRSEWVALLVDKLDMNLADASALTRCVYADSEADPNAVAIETAHAYGILPPADVEDQEQDVLFFHPEQPATREFAAYTSMLAMGFTGEGTLTGADWADLADASYPVQVRMSVQQGFLSLTDGCFLPDNAMTGADKDSIFAAIDRLNASTELPDAAADTSEYEDGVLQDEVNDLSQYAIYEMEDGIFELWLPESDEALQIQPNSVFILPAWDGTTGPAITTTGSAITSSGSAISATGIALKALSMTDEGDWLRFLCEEPDLAEVFDRISFSGYGTGMIGEIEPAEGISVEYDAGGTIETQSADALYPLSIDREATMAVPGTLKFEFANKRLTDALEASGEIAIEIPEIKVKVDASCGWSGVNVDELLVQIKKEIEVTGSLEYTAAESGYLMTNSLGVTRFESGRIELGRLPFAIGATGLSFDLVFFAKLDAKGSLDITWKLEETTGFQYVNGGLRLIKNYDQDLTELELKGTAKFGVGVAGDLCAFHLMDLVGVSVLVGAGFEASFEPHIIPSGTLYCADAALYAFVDAELDQETALGLFLKEVCHITLEWEILSNTPHNPLRMNFHLEDARRVPECTLGEGSISGYVSDSVSNATLHYARVRVLSGSTELRAAYTDGNGRYLINDLDEGTYTLQVSATGYYTYSANVQVREDENTYIETLLMVDRVTSASTGTATGTLIDAVTGGQISGASYAIRSGWNNRTGTLLESGVLGGTDYGLALAVGNYTLQFAKDGYVSNSINVVVNPGSTSRMNVVLSPIGSSVGDGEMRIVLTWGEQPWDVDSHLMSVDQAYHVYFGDKIHAVGTTSIVDLDIDDQNSYGPETITVHDLDAAGSFYYYVHDYSNGGTVGSAALSQSGATVRVYMGGTLIATYSIPVNRTGNYWHVFDYDAASGEIHGVNLFTDLATDIYGN